MNFAIAINDVIDFINEKPKLIKKKKSKYIQKKDKGNTWIKKKKKKTSEKGSIDLSDAKEADVNNNGVIDAWLVDENNNGNYEKAYADQDEDGVIEIVAIDKNEDGNFEVTVAPFTHNYPSFRQVRAQDYLIWHIYYFLIAGLHPVVALEPTFTGDSLVIKFYLYFKVCVDICFSHCTAFHSIAQDCTALHSTP